MKSAVWMGCLRAAAVVAAAVVVAGPALAGNMNPSGGLPRTLTDGKFDLDIHITGILPAEQQRAATDTGDDATLFQHRLAFKMLDLDSTNELVYGPTCANPAPLVPFCVQQRQAASPLTLSSDGQSYQTDYYVTITETTPGFLAQKAASGSLNISIFFYLGPDKNAPPVAKSDPYSLKQLAYVVSEVPTFDGTAPVTGSMKSLVVKWNVKNPVSIIGAPTPTAEPGLVNVYVVDTTIAQSGNINAKKFSGQATVADTAATCTYTAPPDTKKNSTCVTCGTGPTDGDHFYIDKGSLAPGFSVKSTSYKDGSITVTGLENGRDYAVFLQYEPDGLTPNSGQTCLPGVPSPNFTLTELNGEGDATVVDFRCFIATAAYGSPLHPDLHYFRKFRSNVLLKNPVGRAFVHYYYEYSPPLATYIAAHPRVKSAVRHVLEVPAALLKSVDEYY